VVTGIAAGQAVITAQSNGVQGQLLVTVVAPTAASVVLSSSALSIAVGGSATISAVVRSASGAVLSDRPLTWSTSNVSVAGGFGDNASATVQGYAPGSATIRASVDGVTADVQVTVTPAPVSPIASITLSPVSAIVPLGGTAPMVATLRDAQGNIITDRTVTWSSSNLLIVNGLISGNLVELQGLAVGIAVVQATAEGITASANVAVVASVAQPVLNCSSIAGGQVYGADGRFLGSLTNQFNQQSINNTFGQYGSAFSATSMFNQFSNYGSNFSALSAFNTIASSPPVLYVNGQSVAYVSRNSIRNPRIDPATLRACVFP
jgi:uncharacterized protein YjdB